MGFNIANNSLQETCFVLAIVCVALSIAATILRFVAVRRTHRKPGWEDWFAVIALFFFILYVIPLLYLLRVMNGNSTWPKEDVVRIKKAGYSMGPQFCMQQLFAKLSLLFLYYRIFSVSQKFVYSVWFLGIFQTCWSIATYLAHFLECTPPAKLWEPTLPGHCINSEIFLAAGETPNSCVDFAMIGLAIWMVQSLRIEKTTKIKLCFIFILGGLAGILGFVKISEGFGATKKSKVELLDPIWAVSQQTCSIICCCAPVYKPIIPELGIMDKLRSLGSTVFSRSSRSGTRGSRSGTRSGSTQVQPVDEMGSNLISVKKTWKTSEDWVQLDERSLKKNASAISQV